MNSAVSQSLVNLLLASGVPSQEEATELASNLNGGSWTSQVLDSGKVDEQRFLEAIGNYFQVPVISIDAKKIERATLSLLPSRFVFQHHILPIEMKDKTVVLATYDLFNSVGRQLASQLLKGPAEWVLVPRGQILRAMKTVYGVGAETFDEILKANRSFESSQDIEGATDLNADDPDASVVKFVNQIIREAIFERATDIHVEPLENDLRIRYRIDGILHEVAVPPQLRLLAIGHHLALESHGAHGHCRAALAAGRPHQPASARPEHRRARFDHSDREWRIDQFAFAQPRSTAGVRFRASRSQPRAHKDHEDRSWRSRTGSSW